jgi:hypothetical protein
MTLASARSVLLCAAFALLADPAWASCNVDRWRFSFGSDTSTTMRVTSGGHCKMTMSTGRGSGLESIAVTQPAQHGTAASNGSVAYPEIVYTPSRGFKGSDQFVFTLTGGGKNRQGASNVTVAVTVE